MTLSPNGKLLAVGQKNRSIKVWNVQDQTVVLKYAVERDHPVSCAFLSEETGNSLISWTTRVSYRSESFNGVYRFSDLLPGAIRQLAKLEVRDQPFAFIVAGMDDGTLRISNASHKSDG